MGLEVSLHQRAQSQLKQMDFSKSLLDQQNPKAEETRIRMLPSIIKVNKSDLRSLSMLDKHNQAMFIKSFSKAINQNDTQEQNYKLHASGGRRVQQKCLYKVSPHELTIYQKPEFMNLLQPLNVQKKGSYQQYGSSLNTQAPDYKTVLFKRQESYAAV